MGPCISKSGKKKTLKPETRPSPIILANTVPPPKNPLEIKSSTHIRISEEKESGNGIPKQPQSRGSHPTKKKNLTSFNMTDCDVTYTNNNMDISPIYVPRSSYHEKFNFKIKKESDPNPIILPVHPSNRSCFFPHKTRDSRLISQDNLFFLKKNLDYYFRNRPKDELQLEAGSYIPSEPHEEAPVQNISVIELQSHEELKNEPGLQSTGALKREDCRNQLILLTQEILRESQESSFPKEESDLKIGEVLESGFKGGLSTDEEEMLKKYAKIWHQLSDCYQSLNLWSESLNCLLPLAKLYWQLGLQRPLGICQLDSYLVQVMLALLEGNARACKEQDRVTANLGFIDERLNGSCEELAPGIAFLKCFDGILTKNFKESGECLNQLEDKGILSMEEYQDLRLAFSNSRTKEFKALKFLGNIEGMKQELKSYVFDRVRGFKERVLLDWERQHGLKIPYRTKEISGLLVKMGNLLRIWLDLPHHAIFFYESAYKFNPKCLKALFFIAITLRSIGKSPLALEFYLQALKHNPHFVDCYFNMGNIFFEDLSDLPEAEKSYTKALLSYNLTSDPPLVSIGRIYNLLAEIKSQNNEFISALFLNAKGIAHDLTFEENYHDLHKNLAKTGLSAPAFEVFAWIVEVLSLDPSDKPLIAKLKEDKKRLAKLLSSHSPEDKRSLQAFYASGSEGKFLKETLLGLQQEAHAKDLLGMIAERVFQDLEEFFTYVSSRENLAVDSVGMDSIYQKLCVVFNCY